MGVSLCLLSVFAPQISLCLDAVDRRRLNYVFQVSGNYEWDKVLGLYNRSTAFRNDKKTKNVNQVSHRAGVG